MSTNLWQECLTCQDKCCRGDYFPLFIAPPEKKRHPKLNESNLCIFFNRNKLCDIYNERPFDCRFFPFDILKLNGKFTWIIWQVKCSIVEKSKEEFEPYLEEHEQKLIPKFKNYLEDYSKFRLEEFLSKFQYEVLREVKL